MKTPCKGCARRRKEMTAALQRKASALKALVVKAKLSNGKVRK